MAVDVITPETVAARVRHVQSVLEGQGRPLFHSLSTSYRHRCRNRVFVRAELNAAIASCGDVGLAVTSAVMTAASGDVKPAIAALEALQLSRFVLRSICTFDLLSLKRFMWQPWQSSP
jgi:hypothetical protein